MFNLMQVLDPSTVHGPTRRNLIGGADLSEAVRELLLIFELPWYLTGKASTEEVANSFTAFSFQVFRSKRGNLGFLCT
jgi:hypothetical protein